MSAGGSRLLTILGSARPDGDTARAAARLRALLPDPGELVDLAALGLQPFDYARPGTGDGFGEVVEAMLGHDALLLATPVYWYAMSGPMKTLLDRFSDLLGDRDPLGRGRRLAGRDLWLLAVGTDPEMPAGFEVPFARTADYLDLRWRGACYVPSRARATDAEERLARFARRIGAAPGAPPPRRRG